MSASAFAPGKLILMGEHAVVYGHPALAMAVDRGLTVNLVEREGPTRLDEGGVTRATGPEDANLHRGFSACESLMRVGSLAFRACPLPRPP